MQQDRMQMDRRPQRQERGGARGSPYGRPGAGPRTASMTGNDGGGGGDKWQHDMYEAGQDGARRRGGGGRGGFSEGGHYGGHGASPDTPSAKLLVQGLHYDVSEEELQGLFERIGPTIKCFIRYDRSGRSTGTATVIYKDVRHAVTARQEYDGANAKGQPIKIVFEPLREARAAAQGQGGDLLSRLGGGGGGQLLTRMGGGEKGRRPAHAPRGPASRGSAPSGLATAGDAAMSERRMGDGHRGQGRREGRGGRGGGRGGGSGDARRPRGGAPPTADSLDAELDAFMSKPATTDKDVEMQ